MTKEKTKVDWRVSAIAIICLTALEIAALMKGLNGTFLSIAMCAIGLLAGIQINNIKK